MYRQGDLLFLPLAELPSGAKPSRDKTLFQGISNSNTHKLHGDGKKYTLPEAALQKFLENNPRSVACFVKVGKTGATVVHEGAGSDEDRHRPISLPPGVWEVRREEDYTPQALVAVND